MLFESQVAEQCKNQFTTPKAVIGCTNIQLAHAFSLPDRFNTDIAREAMLRTITAAGIGTNKVCPVYESIQILAQVEGVLLAELLDHPVREDLTVLLAKQQ